VLDLSWILLDAATFEAFSIIPQPPTTNQPLLPPSTIVSIANMAPFQLEKLFLHRVSANFISFFSSSPHLAQLKELHLKDSVLTKDIATQLFDSQHSVLKNLTHLHLCLDLDISQNYSALSALAQSPLLSNLVELQLTCLSQNRDQSKEGIDPQFIQQFINSPFLWQNPQLKHLSLKNMPAEFVFDDIISTLDAANVKLETLDLLLTKSSLDALLTASCLSELKQIRIGYSSDLNEPDSFEAFVQSSLLSHLEIFPHQIINDLTSDQLVSILSSPKMSNDLIECNLSWYQSPVKDVVKTLCTQRSIPGDESSPLKFGKLRKLNLSWTDVSDDDVKLIVANLTQLTHLELNKMSLDSTNPITNNTITALVSAERANPCYPSTSLPNLVHLDIKGSKISHTGLIRLSQSQLLDQLEYLDVSKGSLLRQNPRTSKLPSGLKALFTTPLASNLKQLNVHDLTYTKLKGSQPQDGSLLKYLGHCCIQE
jgi:hypothetical protein